MLRFAASFVSKITRNTRLPITSWGSIRQIKIKSSQLKSGMIIEHKGVVSINEMRVTLDQVSFAL